MTPEEKAKGLLVMFQPFCAINIARVPIGKYDYAKRCALIAVEELIKYLPSSAGNPPNLQENEYDKEWWEKVKDEINKL